MKDLREALINKNNIKSASARKNNKFGITKDDLIGDLEGFTLGVVIRMIEEQEMQGNKTDIEVFQENKCAGFKWDKTESGVDFWYDVVVNKDFDVFYNKYPEYKKYDK